MTKDRSLKVYVFNAGAGDHILLEFPDGSLGIIDCFFQVSDLNLQELPALTYLKHLQQRRKQNNEKGPLPIAFLCLSHADMDHLTGLDTLLDFIQKEENNIELENLWLFGGKDIEEYIRQLIEQFSTSLNEMKGDAKEEVRVRIKNYRNRLFRLDEFRKWWRAKPKYERSERYLSDVAKINKYGVSGGFMAYSLGPTPAQIANYDQNVSKVLIRTMLGKMQDFANPELAEIELKYKGAFDRNDVSSILCITYGKYKLIFGGDAGTEAWEASLREVKQFKLGKLLRPDFLKASHHGSKNSTSPNIWESLFKSSRSKKTKDCCNQKLFVGISAGKRNSHPNDEFFQDIDSCCQGKNISSSIHRTNECRNCYAQHLESRYLKWFDDVRESFDHPYANQLLEALDNEKATFTSPDKNPEENLLAYIFEFPERGSNDNISVVRGVAKHIGAYTNCVFEKKSPCYCKENGNRR